MTQRNIEKTVKMPHMGLSGYVRMSIINPDGSVAWESGFSNLILDQGLDEIAARPIVSCFEHCAVGTGNSSPTTTQIELDNEIARTNNYLTGHPNTMTEVQDAGVTPAFMRHRRTFDFPQGTLDSGVDGDYQEIGFSWSGTAGQNLFSRALIRDDQGTVVAVSVASDQILRVEYILEVQWSPAENSQTPAGIADSFSITNIGTINVSHLLYAMEPQVSTSENGFRYITNTTHRFWCSYVREDGTTSSDGFDSTDVLEPYRNAVSGDDDGLVIEQDGALMPASFDPHFIDRNSGTWTQPVQNTFPFAESTYAGAILSKQAYSAGSFQIQKIATFDVNQGNFEVAHISAWVEMNQGSGSFRVPAYRATIDSADRFTKVNTHTLTLNLLLTWGRI